MNISKATIWYKNFPAGRFANAAFEYLFLKYLSIKTDCRIIIGDNTEPESIVAQNLIGFEPNFEMLGDLKHLQYQTIRFPSDRTLTPDFILNYLVSHVTNDNLIYEIDDYFQFDTRNFNPDFLYGQLFQLLYQRRNDGNKFQQLLNNYSSIFEKKFNDLFLISVHVRRGDYVQHESLNDPTNPFYTFNLDSLYEYIENLILIQRVKNVAVFVASDDIQYCKDFFSNTNINIITSEDVFGTGFSESETLVQDITLMSNSDITICSNSSLSIFGALLNCRCKMFVRYIKGSGFTSFHPYNTPILIGV